MESENIGKRIKKYRETAGLSQDQLAETIDTSRNLISQIERGVKLPGLDNFIKIANALNVSADLLLVDVLTNSYKVQSSVFLDRVEVMPPRERQRLLAVMDALLADY